MSTGDVFFGEFSGIRLLWDTVHDEVYLEGSGLVVMSNNRWVLPVDDLRFICLCLSMGLEVNL